MMFVPPSQRPLVQLRLEKEKQEEVEKLAKEHSENESSAPEPQDESSASELENQSLASEPEADSSNSWGFLDAQQEYDDLDMQRDVAFKIMFFFFAFITTTFGLLYAYYKVSIKKEQEEKK